MKTNHNRLERGGDVVTITLKRAARCAECGAELSPGEKARWYRNGAVYGTGCHARSLSLTVRRVAKAAFPEYRGRKFGFQIEERTVPAPQPEPVDLHSNYWDGGTRSFWRFVRLSDLKIQPMPTAHPGFEKKAADVMKQAVLPPNFAVVEHSIFCGKDMGLRVYVLPENAPTNPADEAIKLVRQPAIQEAA